MAGGSAGGHAAGHRRFVNDCPGGLGEGAVFRDGVCVSEQGGEPVALTGLGR